VAGDTAQPPDIQAALDRARGVVERNAAAVQQRLIDGLKASGHDPAAASPRFAASVEISLGKRQVYHQGPTRYYFPGLPQRQFYPREEFGWAPAVERASEAIAAELRALLAEGGHFSPYLQSSANQPAMNERGLLDSDDWSACYLIQNGAVTAVGDRCPQTLAALEAAPVPRIPARSPNVLFSRLAPHTRIPAHNGFLNTRLICHLPLIVPPACGRLRCGSEEQAWEEGRLMCLGTPRRLETRSKPEGRALPGLAGHTRVATHQASDFTRGGQAHTEPAMAARGRGITRCEGSEEA
jgi:hypothetical protein